MERGGREGRVKKREWSMEKQAGRPVRQARRKQEGDHLIERVGEELRAMMSWLQENR